MSIKYFGIEATYNPFSNAEDLQQVSNAVFSIANEPNFATTYAVSVSTGLVPTAISFLSADFSATILNADGTTLLQILKAKIGSIGNNEYPQVDEIVWFDVEGMQSAFWIHSEHKGKILKISGKFQTTAITAEISALSLTGLIMACGFNPINGLNDLPPNSLICDGSSVSRSRYKKLFSKIGATWGRGNGSTTFNIPDGRGGVLKGVGNSSKYQYNENRGVVGSYQGTAIRNIKGSFEVDDTTSSKSPLFRMYGSAGGPRGDGSGHWCEFDASRVVPTGETNRDNNLGVHWIIFT